MLSSIIRFDGRLTSRKYCVMNPFQFGSVVRGEHFFDRREETARIVETLSGGNNLVLFAPRRYGKTSLVFRAMAELENRGITCIYFDFLPIYDLRDFCRVYTQRLLEKQKGWQKLVSKLADWLKGTRPKITLSADGKAALELDFPESVPTPEILESVLNLPERIAGDGRRLVVVLDEFQEVSRFEKNRFEALLRSIIQHQKHVSYVFLGSKTHLLNAMFTERSRPFFNSAATMKISKLPLNETVDFLTSRFEKTGFSLSTDLARRIVEASDGVPYYIQLLAAEIWQNLNGSGEKAVTDSLLDLSISQVVSLKKDYYAELYDRLSLQQKKLVRAIAHCGEGIFSTAFTKRFSLGSTSSTQKAATVLTEQGIIEKENGNFHVADPFFRRFLLDLP